MAVNETQVTGRKYRVWDDINNIWKRFSFWTKASDVELNNGTTVEGAISQIDTNKANKSGGNTFTGIQTFSGSQIKSKSTDISIGTSGTSWGNAHIDIFDSSSTRVAYIRPKQTSSGAVDLHIATDSGTNSNGKVYVNGVDVNELNNDKLDKTGASTNNTVAYTSADNSSIFNSGNLGGQSVYAWSAVAKISSGEKHSSLLNKISTMFKNVRTIAKLIGTTNISSIGNGTLSGSISNLNTSLSGKASTSDVTFGNQIVADISASTGVEVGKYIREHIDLSKLQKGYVFNFIPIQTPGWWSGIIYCDNPTWTTGTTCWGFYMNRDNNMLYKYNYTYGGADSVTPFSGNISPRLIGQWTGSNVTRSFTFDSSKSYFLGGADQFNDSNFRSFCAVLVKGTIVPIIGNSWFRPSVSGNTCNIAIPQSGSTISLYVVQLN